MSDAIEKLRAAETDHGSQRLNKLLEAAAELTIDYCTLRTSADALAEAAESIVGGEATEWFLGGPYADEQTTQVSIGLLRVLLKELSAYRAATKGAADAQPPIKQEMNK